MVDMTQRLERLSPAQRKLLEARLKKKPNVSQPIAIVGMSCRLPGAKTLDEYWDLIVNQRTSVTEIPADRWDVEEFYDKDPDTVGKSSIRWGAFVDDVDQFDSIFFGIAPREAARMDPQQRMLLECAWEAIEHSGMSMDQLSGSATGMFVGIGGSDYGKLPLVYDNRYEYIDAHMGTGNALSIAANRVSYILDLRGPSMAIDTACSSGLVGLHYAVQSLRSGECNAALAGAVNLILSPEVIIAFSKARMLSPTGECRPFDADANGYVRGEGCALLMLKRLTDATRDGDNILAVIRGSAVNQDGRTSGITAPNSLSQIDCIRAAHRSAGIDASEISFIEAHGTGTPLGDPIEFQSLSTVFPRRNKKDRTVHVSSVKANIGHTETVSGIAGLIKVALMMKHGIIPPQRHLESLNPNIQLAGTRLKIATESTPWQSEGTHLAGVSSFGFGGTNSHVIIESVQSSTAVEDSGSDSNASNGQTKIDRPRHLLKYSAKSKKALTEITRQYRDRLSQIDDAQIADFCYSANTGRSDFNHRVAFSEPTREKLLASLQSVADGKRSPRIKQTEVQIATKPKIAFLFTGQGSQYYQMGRDFYEHHPVFRSHIDHCNTILMDHRNISLIDVMFPEDNQSPLHETAYTQPAMFALEYAIARLWQSWGVEPSIMLGYSVGEYVAACIAGVFNLEDSLRLIAKRAELMQQLPQNGKMTAVFAGREEVEKAIAHYGEKVVVATANGPENNVIAGEAELVDQAVAEFAKKGVGTQPLKVSHAFHSPLMDPMLDEFEAFAAQMTYHRPTVPIVANRTGTIIQSAEFDAAYWRDHIRNCVEFEAGMNSLQDEGVHAFLEIGPSASCLGMGRRCLQNYQAAWVPSLRKGRDAWDCLLGAVAELYGLGVKIDWRGFDRPWRRRRLDLPHYPFQRTEHWLLPRNGKAQSGGVRGRSLHPLLGARYTTAVDSQIFECRYGVDNPKHLKDHVVQGSIVAPGSSYIEQGLAAATIQFGPGDHAVENVAIQTALFIPMEGQRIVQLTASPELGGRSTFQTYSISAETEDETPNWQLHVIGTMVHGESVKTPIPDPIDLDAVRSRFVVELTHEEFYDTMAFRNLNYGPAFRILDGMGQTESEALAPIAMTESVRDDVARYHVHPALGDALMQAIAGVVPKEPNNDFAPYTYVPTQIQRARKMGAWSDTLFAFARRTSNENQSSPESIQADAFLVDEQGNVLVEFTGVTVQRIGKRLDGKGEVDPKEWLYTIDWDSQPLTDPDASPDAQDPTPALSGRQLVFVDRSGFGKALCEQIQAAGGSCITVTPTANGSDASFSASENSFALDPTNKEHYQRLFEAITDGPPITDVLHLWSIDQRVENLQQARDEGIASLLLMLQQAARSPITPLPHCWLISCGAQNVLSGDAPEKIHPAQSAVWGLGRVAAMEHPELNIRLLDLDPAEDVNTSAQSVVENIVARPDESQIAYREASRHVARLESATGILQSRQQSKGIARPAGGPYRLRIASPGSFDALYYEPFQPKTPEQGEVQIQVKATGLNFSDVLKALGLYPGITDAIVPLGIEAAGIVTKIGPGVERFAVGDEVMGVLPYSFASHATTRDYALVKKPANIDFEEASTIPITFLTAYYGLIRLAHLQQGERVLIHAGAGGVGQAAIQIAKHVGAEIFCTAGNDEKREFLRDLGIAHVMNSRTLDFEDEIREITDREGVDVVLNSLPGDAITASLNILRAYGRFLEIGKTDIYSNSMIGLLPFQDNLSYFAIDLDRMLRQRSQYVLDMFSEMMQFFADGIFTPMPFTRFTTEDTIESFRYMAQRKNIGKVVVAIDSPEASPTPGEAMPASFQATSDGTWLITGGLGALGLQIAHWLGTRGAKHVALLSRRPVSEAGQAAIDQLAAQGVQASALQGDVGQLDSLRNAITQIPQEYPRNQDGSPRIAGIFHAAGVLADGVMFDMELEQLDKPLTAKIQGTLNLHALSQDINDSQSVDCFVMFSSVAAVLGSPGQSNYAAGNAFLDGMAAWRKSEGLPATSINWGPWADSGMAVDGDLKEQLASRGMGMLRSDEALDLMGNLIASQRPQTVVMSVDWPNLVRASGGKPQALLRNVTKDVEIPTGDSAEDRAFRETLAKEDIPERKKRLVAYFAEELANIMGMDTGDIDVVQPLNAMGLDSLMAIELKNKIESRLQIALPMSAFMEEPSVDSLANFTAENLNESANA